MPRGEDNSLLQVARRKHKLCRKQERIVLSIVKSTGHIVTTCIKGGSLTVCIRIDMSHMKICTNIKLVLFPILFFFQLQLHPKIDCVLWSHMVTATFLLIYIYLEERLIKTRNFYKYSAYPLPVQLVGPTSNWISTFIYHSILLFHVQYLIPIIWWQLITLDVND